MLLFIAINTIEIAIENPLNDPTTLLALSLRIIDYSMTLVFSFESIIKIIANGAFFNGERSYFKNYLNLMDIAVVIVTVSNFFHYLL